MWIGIGLALPIAGGLLGCRKGSQYQETPPPPPLSPDAVTLPPPTDDGTGIWAPPTEPNLPREPIPGAGTQLDEKQALSKINEINQADIVWGERVGQLVIGETETRLWEATVNQLEATANTFTQARASLCNLKYVDNERECGTVSGITIYGGFGGTLKMPSEFDEKLYDVPFSSVSLTDLGLIARRNGDINPKNPQKSTRARELFRKFFNVFVRKEGPKSDYDCFTSSFRECSYMLWGEAHYGFQYVDENGASGFLAISRGQGGDRLIQASFENPDTLPPGRLYGRDVRFDLFDQTFYTADDEALLTLGDSFEKLSDPNHAGVPEDEWHVDERFHNSYLGLGFALERQNVERFAEKSYLSPDPSDPVVVVSFFKEFRGSIVWGSGEGSEISYSDSAMANFNREQRIAYLKKFAATIAKKAKESQYRVLLNSVRTEMNENAKASQELEMVLENDRGEGLSLLVASQHGASHLYIQVARVAKEPLSFLQVSRHIPGTDQVDGCEGLAVDPKNPLGVTIACLPLGKKVYLKDENLHTGEATLLLGEGYRERRVNFSPREYLLFPPLKDQDLGSERLDGKRVEFERLQLHLTDNCDEAVSIQTEGACYRIGAITSSLYLDRSKDDPHKEALTLGCGMTLYKKMPLDKFVAEARKHRCRITTLENEAGEIKKLFRFIPQDRLRISFSGNDYNYVSSITRY